MSINICGKKEYKVESIRGGKGAKSEYTFLTISAIPNENAKFVEKAKINIWGEDISNKISQGNLIRILGANETGLDKFTTQNGNTYYNTLIVCSGDDIELSQPSASVEQTRQEVRQQRLEEMDDSQLPF